MKRRNVSAAKHAANQSNLNRKGKRGVEKRQPLAVMIGRDNTKTSSIRKAMYRNPVTMGHEIHGRAPIEQSTSSEDVSR